ncbi:MAG: 50S ribosomal protein L10 [Tissierellia bacterium]|nr:50S ribosomal protein L10 [Tissierellia bacterium]
MSEIRQRKEMQVQEIREKFQKASSAVIVDYRGLNVAEVTELRSKFREQNVEYKVYKNRLVKLALEGTDFEALEAELTGPNAIAFGYEDAVAPAKIIKDFSKKVPELELKAGIVDGIFYDVEGITLIADIPSRDVLLAKFLGSIQSPISKLAYALKAVADEKED